jgi:hypothetical protein
VRWANDKSGVSKQLACSKFKTPHRLCLFIRATMLALISWCSQLYMRHLPACICRECRVNRAITTPKQRPEDCICDAHVCTCETLPPELYDVVSEWQATQIGARGYIEGLPQQLSSAILYARRLIESKPQEFLRFSADPLRLLLVVQEFARRLERDAREELHRSVHTAPPLWRVAVLFHFERLLEQCHAELTEKLLSESVRLVGKARKIP